MVNIRIEDHNKPANYIFIPKIENNDELYRIIGKACNADAEYNRLENYICILEARHIPFKACINGMTLEFDGFRYTEDYWICNDIQCGSKYPCKIVQCMGKPKNCPTRKI